DEQHRGDHGELDDRGPAPAWSAGRARSGGANLEHDSLPSIDGCRWGGWGGSGDDEFRGGPDTVVRAGREVSRQHLAGGPVRGLHPDFFGGAVYVRLGAPPRHELDEVVDGFVAPRYDRVVERDDPRLADDCVPRRLRAGAQARVAARLERRVQRAVR